MKLTSTERDAMLKGLYDPFRFYEDVADNNITLLQNVRARLRSSDGVENDTSLVYNRILNVPAVKSASSSLQKLLAIENLIKKECILVALSNIQKPQVRLGGKRVDDKAGRMICTRDTMFYYPNKKMNQVAFIAVDMHNPQRMYVFNDSNYIMDSIPLRASKYESLLSSKEDVFLLYRGWLELKKIELENAIKRISSLLKENQVISAAYWSENTSGIVFERIRLKRKLDDLENEISNFWKPPQEFVDEFLLTQQASAGQEIAYMNGLGFAYTAVAERGRKVYELPDHRGNVMGVISDRKEEVRAQDGTVSFYQPDVTMLTDYAPFGAALPSRVLAKGYRYGYNGKEKDENIGQEDYDYGARIYDPRIGRFLSVDALAKVYPFYTPYQFAGNMPIAAVDLDGNEVKISFKYGLVWKDRTKMEIVTSMNIQIQVINLSSTADGDINLDLIANNLGADLQEKLGGAHTMSYGNFPYKFLAKNNNITAMVPAKSSNDFDNYNLTYNTDVTAQVSVIHDMSQIKKDGLVFAIVDKLEPVETNGQTISDIGLARLKGRVAMGEASYFSLTNFNSQGRSLILHEVMHLFGAKDTYPPNTDFLPGTNNRFNLMYSVAKDGSSRKLTEAQVITEVLMQTIGLPTSLLDPKVRPYKQPEDNGDRLKATAQELREFIQANGSAAKLQ